MDRETAEEITRHFSVFAESLQSEITRHFNVVAESLRSEIRTVAEGFVSTNERLDRIETGMSERFSELEAMIRLSFGELERRIQ